MTVIPFDAQQAVDAALADKPELEVREANLLDAALGVRDLLAKMDDVFERGEDPVEVTRSSTGVPFARPFSVEMVVAKTMTVAQPIQYKRNKQGNYDRIPITLPDRVARLYLSLNSSQKKLRLLKGFTSAPILSDDGRIRHAEGYDEATGLFAYDIPELDVPSLKSAYSEAKTIAKEALARLRERFKTFPFADAARLYDEQLKVEVVDTAKPPGVHESTFLCALLTSVCRPCLWLAPGLAVNAPAHSGSGAGKGMLVRAISFVAFGYRPGAMTVGHGKGEELDKRLVAQLIRGEPVLFLDNVNNTALQSDTLGSILTERPAKVRRLGHSEMVSLDEATLVAVTGNGLTTSEDLVRKFMVCSIDPQMEDPENRVFAPGFLSEIADAREALLRDVLTIWRLGRRFELPKGKALGSYEQWGEWCRDPLLELGCQDPVERLKALKASDPMRQLLGTFLHEWFKCHGTEFIRLSKLDKEVRHVIDPDETWSRQQLVTWVNTKVGARVGGYVLIADAPEGTWGTYRYAVRNAARKQ
jgi:hypothetical protein